MSRLGPMLFLAFSGLTLGSLIGFEAGREYQISKNEVRADTAVSVMDNINRIEQSLDAHKDRPFIGPVPHPQDMEAKWLYTVPLRLLKIDNKYSVADVQVLKDNNTFFITDPYLVRVLKIGEWGSYFRLQRTPQGPVQVLSVDKTEIDFNTGEFKAPH